MNAELIQSPTTFAYDGSGVYEDRHGKAWFVDPMPEPQSRWLRNWFVLSETAEDRDHPMPEKGTVWIPARLIGETLVRKLEGSS